MDDKQQVSEILEKQKKLEKNIDDISDKNKENNALLNEFSEQDKRILEKQKQLELMEELMTEEIRGFLMKWGPLWTKWRLMSGWRS